MLVLHDLPDFIACLNEPDQIALLGAPSLHRCINEATKATGRRTQRKLTQPPPVPLRPDAMIGSVSPGQTTDRNLA